LRLIGKQEDQFNEELRTEAESRIRRSLALDAFADAEQVGVEDSEVQDEVRRAAEATDEPEAVQRLALNNPDTLQRVQEVTRERKALARLMELAAGDGRAATAEDASKNPTVPAQTTDTHPQSPEASPELATTAAEEDRGTE
jgi:trigger factor